MMTIQELEQQLLNLDQNERIHILQILAQSLTPSPVIPSTSSPSPQNLADFFRNSPLAEAIASGELELKRDPTIELDRFVL